MKGFRVKLNYVKEGFIRFIKDERGDGGGPLNGLVWAAIVILAVIALQPLVDAAFTTFGGSFQTWLVTIATRVFR